MNSLHRSVIMRTSSAVFVALVIAGSPTVASAQTETVEYYGLDAIGSVRAVFDANGNVLARLDYDPFGRELAPSANAPDRKFAGLFRDAEAGLDYAQARSYQVRTGRFSSPDPVYAGLFEPQAWNRYSYALSNPIVFVDPDGLDPFRTRSNPGCSTFASMCGGGAQTGPRGGSEVTDGLVSGGGRRRQRPNPDRPGRGGVGGRGGATTGTGQDQDDTGGTATPAPTPTPSPGPTPSPPPPSPPQPAGTWTGFRSCWADHFSFSRSAANMPLLDLVNVTTGIDIPGMARHIPGIPKSIGNLGTTIAGITGATARSAGTVTAFEAAKAIWSNGGWVANLKPTQVLVSAGMNTALSGALGYVAYQGGVAVGASAYATGQTLARNCQ